MEETAARQVSEDETAARQMKMKLPPNFLLAAAQIAPRQRCSLSNLVFFPSLLLW